MSLLEIIDIEIEGIVKTVEIRGHMFGDDQNRLLRLLKTREYFQKWKNEKDREKLLQELDG